MGGFLLTVAVLALSSSLASAGPCGFGALCGRSQCDGATVSAFDAALPAILACEKEFEPYKNTYPQDNEAALRTACLGGACGAAFDTLVKFYDIERNVCELNSPKVLTGAIMYVSNGYSVICIAGSTTVEAFPAVKAELAARIAKARGVKDATTTTPSTTAPAPTTKTLAPTTTTTTAPAPTTSAPTPTPTPTSTSTPTTTPTTTNATTAAPAETTSGSETNETDASRVDEQAVAEPTATIKPSAVPTPTTAAPPKASQATKTMVSVLAVVASVGVFVF